MEKELKQSPAGNFATYKQAQKDYDLLTKMWEQISDMEEQLNGWGDNPIGGDDIMVDEGADDISVLELLDKVSKAISKRLDVLQMTAIKASKNI